MKDFKISSTICGSSRVIRTLEIKNGSLQRKVKRLLRITKQQSRVRRDQNMKIEATEAEILRNCDELETRSNVRERS